jgi:hypothetical protein
MPEKREVASLQCLSDLNQHQLIKPNTKWKTKSIGVMDGIILFGLHKTGLPKTTFVKKYEDKDGRKFHELDEFLLYNIAHQCGINLPKIKLKSTTNHIYSFSRDIADSKKPYDSKRFILLKEFIKKDGEYKLDDKCSMLTLGTQHFLIDKSSIAKIALASIIFETLDYHPENIGFVIDNNQSIAELALVDFVISHNNLLHPKYNKYDSISTLVSQQHTNKVSLRFAHVDLLTDQDFLDAYIDIEKKFHDACKTTFKAACALSFEPWRNKKHAESMLNKWKRNVQELSTFIKRISIEASTQTEPDDTVSPNNT